MYDVAVVGGGLTGSHIAARLAGMGHSVVVIEGKRSLTEPVCCTGLVSRECVSAFAIEEDLIFRWVKSARMLSPSGRSLKLWRPEPQAAVVDRVSLNVAMVGRAQGRGVRYETGAPVAGVTTTDDCVRIEALREGGSVTLEARAAVIATGFSPAFTRRLGLGQITDMVMGAQTEVVAPRVDEVRVYFGAEVAPSFFAWVVPTTAGMALVGLLSRKSPRVYLQRLVSSLTDRGDIASSSGNVLVGGIPLRPLPRTYADRMLVVGTAAGQVKPTTGGGIYCGLICANIAAEYLHRALVSDRLSARHLSGYQREWKRVLGQELRIGYWARRVYEHLSDRQVDRGMEMVESSGLLDALLNDKDLSFDWPGRAVARALRHQALHAFLRSVRLPARLRSHLLQDAGHSAEEP